MLCTYFWDLNSALGELTLLLLKGEAIKGKEYWKSKHEQIRDVLFPLLLFPFAKDWKITDIATVVAEATEKEKESEKEQIILVLFFVLYLHPNLPQSYCGSDNDKIVFFPRLMSFFFQLLLQTINLIALQIF